MSEFRWFSAVPDFHGQPVQPDSGDEVQVVRASAYDSLSARCAALEQDAARYRWLKADMSIDRYGRSTAEVIIDTLSPHNWDSAIDAAMRTGK